MESGSDGRPWGMVFGVQRVGITFCLMALAVVQVPWIVCTGCCEDVVMAAISVHACHMHEKDAAHGHGHAHGGPCTCGHDEPEEPAEENPATDHLLVQLPAVAAGTPVVLPDHLPTDSLRTAPGLLPPMLDAIAASGHDPTEEAPAIPRGASERLLL